MINRITKEPIKSITCEYGKLYAIRDGKRLTLANCKFDLEIYQISYDVEIMNKKSYDVKDIKTVLAISYDRNFEEKVDIDYINSIEAFEASFEIHIKDKEYIKFNIEELSPITVDLYEEEWIFELTNREDIDKILKLEAS